MKRIVGALLLVGIVGCVNVDGGPETGGARPNYGRSFGPPMVPGVEGPYGAPVPMAAPYNASPPGSQWAAQQMMRNPVPMSMLQMNPQGMPMSGPMGGMMPPLPIPPGGLPTPPGISLAPGMPTGMPFGPPGMPPGMPMGPNGPPGMPGKSPFGPNGPMGPSLGAMGQPPGNIQRANFLDVVPNSNVVQANVPPGSNLPGNVIPAQFANSSPVGSLFPAQRTQVFFSRPAGMKVYWYSQGKDGKPNYSLFPLETPGRYNFAQSAIYRLKLTHIPGRPGLELYPTLEVVPTSPKTNEFLAHNSVPLEFTDEDFKQVVDRNYIVKVIYLPDPQFQDVAGAGPDEIVSTRLEPGQDPIQEALRRGSILLVLRIGNIDQEVPNTPSLTTPMPGGAMMPPPGLGAQPFFQVPFFGPGVKPGLMPVPNGMMPPPNMMPPGMMPPGVIPPGLGAEAERNKPNQLAPLPPLPNEQNNKLNPMLPFGPPDVPAKEANGGLKPEIKSEPLAPPGTNLGNKPKPLAPFPVLPIPDVEFKGPAKDQAKSPPALFPNKAESSPPTGTPNLLTPATPVSNPKTESSSGTPMPPLPSLSNLPPLPPMSDALDPSKGTIPVSGTLKNANSEGPAVGLPGMPALPPLNLDLQSSPDVRTIPAIPASSGKK